jgi:hypothetical protein
MTIDLPTAEDFAAYWRTVSQSARNIGKRSIALAAYSAGFEAAKIPTNEENTVTATLTVTLEEAQVLAQALDLLASDPGLISAEWPNIEGDDHPALARLGYAALDLSSRVHDLINTTATAGGRGINGASTPS